MWAEEEGKRGPDSSGSRGSGMEGTFSNFLLNVQAHSYPWIAALMDKNGQQIDSFCSSVLVSVLFTVVLCFLFLVLAIFS